MNMEYAIRVTDQNPYTVEVGGELALTVEVDGQSTKKVWSNNWDKWTELHDHEDFKQLLAA